MQLRLNRGMDLDEYARWGGQFTPAQMTFLRHCVASGYARFADRRLQLTPAGMVVQNAILEALL